MSENSKSQTRDEKGMSDSYRLVVFRSEDFQEVRSFNLTLGSIYIATSAFILTMGFLLFSLFAFTPLKRLIPGYGKIESNQQFLQLVNSVDEIATKIDAQEVYISALRNMVSTGLSNSEMGKISDIQMTTPKSEPITNDIANIAPLRNKVQTDQKDIKAINSWASLSDKKLFTPVGGIVSSNFDPTIKHFGVDILAPAQTPIIAILDGFVFSSGWDLETGYTIGIQHEGNILSFYKHNSQLLKEKGTFVAAGEAVAIIGNTGTLSTGPHLHFELWHNGKPINPKDILNFN